jgi:adenylyl-sulfate kinase
LLVQLTGLSGAGKTTIADAVKHKLALRGIAVRVIDGDLYRKTICRDLGFSKEDRQENIRRLGSVAVQSLEENRVAILAAINPYQEIRTELKEKYKARTVYVECDLDTLLQRDTKGLYKRALLPEEHPEKLFSLTGINDPYEVPVDADLVLKTDIEAVNESVEKLYTFILDHIGL